MNTFYRLLAVALISVTTNNFVWFALIYWAYLTTRSVVSTSTMAGIFLVLTAVSGLWFGSVVDHQPITDRTLNVRPRSRNSLVRGFRPDTSTGHARVPAQPRPGPLGPIELPCLRWMETLPLPA
jgi:hypothetical protein